MSGTDGSPETTPGMPATRGIEPPTSGFGPPPPPDFGIIAADYPVEPVLVQPLPSRRTVRPGAIVAIIAAILVVFVLLLGLVVVGISNLLSLAGDPGQAAPSSESNDSGQSDPDQGQGDPGPGSGAVETTLQAMIDEYKTARETGSLWADIPDSEYNRTAVSAFVYLLTDLKLAASFGADTSVYLERANDLEQKLLNQEPLGTDISIKLSDRTFTYDGDTGEGGYTAN